LHLAGGTYNTALGWASLDFNVTGNFNTGVGAATLLNNTADENTAIGAGALLSNTTGTKNTPNGGFTLVSNTTGSSNIALGVAAGSGITTVSNVIAIGAPGANLGNSCYVGQIFAQPVDPATAVPVFVDTNGKLGTAFSSRRFKHDIKPMDKASEAIMALKPVTFHYKSGKSGTPQFGLIAEEVAEINPNLVVRDDKGEIYTVRYDAVNAMLLNEFLKEHKAFLEEQRKVQILEANDAEREREVKALVETVKEQTAQIQKVSAQLEASKPAPQVVNNP